MTVASVCGLPPPPPTSYQTPCTSTPISLKNQKHILPCHGHINLSLPAIATTSDHLCCVGGGYADRSTSGGGWPAGTRRALWSQEGLSVTMQRDDALHLMQRRSTIALCPQPRVRKIACASACRTRMGVVGCAGERRGYSHLPTAGLTPPSPAAHRGPRTAPGASGGRRPGRSRCRGRPPRACGRRCS